MDIDSLIDKPLAEQRVTITGASGFIGSKLVTRLAREGASVLAIDRI